MLLLLYRLLHKQWMLLAQISMSTGPKSQSGPPFYCCCVPLNTAGFARQGVSNSELHFQYWVCHMQLTQAGKQRGKTCVYAARDHLYPEAAWGTQAETWNQGKTTSLGVIKDELIERKRLFGLSQCVGTQGGPGGGGGVETCMQCLTLPDTTLHRCKVAAKLFPSPPPSPLSTHTIPLPHPPNPLCPWELPMHMTLAKYKLSRDD